MHYRSTIQSANTAAKDSCKKPCRCVSKKCVHKAGAHAALMQGHSCGSQLLVRWCPPEVVGVGDQVRQLRQLSEGCRKRALQHDVQFRLTGSAGSVFHGSHEVLTTRLGNGQLCKRSGPLEAAWIALHAGAATQLCLQESAETKKATYRHSLALSSLSYL